MPIYDFNCPNCKKDFEDIRSIKDPNAGRMADCPNCTNPCNSDDRDFSKASFSFIGASVSSPEFNPGLGCVVKNKAHKEDLLKAKGLVEVGNDFSGGEKMQNHFEKRKDEEREKRWEDPKNFSI